MKEKIIRVIFPVLLAFLMVLIFCLSAQPSKESSKLSRGFTYKVFSAIYPNFSDMTESEKQGIVESFSFVIRKLAHFSLYFFLGLMTLLSVITYNKFSIIKRATVSFLFCVMYAASDEIHQYFVPGRSCELRDVLIDSSGALLSILLTVLLLKIISKKKV